MGHKSQGYYHTPNGSYPLKGGLLFPDAINCPKCGREVTTESLTRNPLHVDICPYCGKHI